jgi:hypothetical protein
VGQLGGRRLTYFLIGYLRLINLRSIITMDIKELVADKAIKPKEKTETISRALLDGSISMKDVIEFAAKGKDPVKATCIESIEFATKQNPEIANEHVLAFVTQTLTEKAPRVKWESAKVVGNIAHLFPSGLDKAISNLLVNTEHSGTVVRWSAAYALGEILKLKTKHNKELLPAVEAICEREEKNSIRKIYLSAIKAIKK